MFGIKIEEKKVSILIKIFVMISAAIHAPVEFIRKRRAVAKRKLLGAERRNTRLNILAGLNAQLKEVDARIDSLIMRSVVERINLDHEIEVTTQHKLYLEGEIQRYS